MMKLFRRKKKETRAVGLEHPVEVLSQEELERLTATTDFTPDNIKAFRGITLTVPVHSYPDFVKVIYVLLGRYVSNHCNIRFECQNKGEIAACLSCFAERVLVPDLQKMAGGKIAMWPAKR